MYIYMYMYIDLYMYMYMHFHDASSIVPHFFTSVSLALALARETIPTYMYLSVV